MVIFYLYSNRWRLFRIAKLKEKPMTTKNSPEPFYSMARRAGDTLYLSGFGPVDQDLNVVGATIEDQTVFTMDAMKAVLEVKVLRSTMWCVSMCFVKHGRSRWFQYRLYALLSWTHAYPPPDGAGDL